MSLIEFLQLKSIRKEQQQSNELLEQIRRLQLTPAQLATEEAQRAAEAKAEEKWDATLRKRRLIVGYSFLFFVVAVACLSTYHPAPSPAPTVVSADADPRYPGAILDREPQRIQQ